jgi:hypothetical protein
VAHHHHREEEHRRIERMQPHQPVEHPLTVLVAEVVPRDQRHEQEPE